jgi:hypothetical protein
MADLAASLETPADLGKDAAAEAKRWKLELKLADKRESNWRKKATDIYKVYAPESPVANSFNILWTNTETLRQSVYNSLPQPDVRRRYSTEDPLGKAVSEILSRALEFAQDVYDFDAVIKADVLSMLLPGRAVARVEYIPDVKGDDTAATVDWEQVQCKHVQWDDFRILCAAKTWQEVTAIGFRHKMSREDLVEKFGEKVGNAIALDDVEDEDVRTNQAHDLFKTADVWEIWDYEGKADAKVVWVSVRHPTLLKKQKDPLKLQGFWPVPRPLYAIENDQTLVPTPLFAQYEQQAKELNRVSTRINKLVDGLKVRGIYDSTVAELANLQNARDYELVPAQNVTALLERGGLEKAIWMMPIETAAMVLKELYVQRDATKQVVYEITGISDIMRAATDPAETFGAQKLKSQWGTQRLQRMQLEVQRYIRDIIRMKGEIIAEKFQQSTLERMTLVDLPHKAEIDAQKAQLMQQYQQAVMQAMQAGKPAPQMPQLPPDPVTWESAYEAMRNDATRTYRIDIETDSTIAATQDADLEGLQATLKGMADLIIGFGPAVQAGAIPIDAVKALMGVIARRSRMGTVVEDALEKIKPPQPGADPEQAKAQAAMQQQQAQQQHEAQLEQMRMQHEAQLEQVKAQTTIQIERDKAQMQAQVDQHRQEVEAQQKTAEREGDAQLARFNSELAAQQEAQRQAHERQLTAAKLQHEREKADADNAVKLQIAEMQRATTLETAERSAQTTERTAAMGAETERHKAQLGSDTTLKAAVEAKQPAKPDTTLMKAVEGLSEQVKEMKAHATAPRKKVRDKAGKLIGVQIGDVTIPIQD